LPPPGDEDEISGGGRLAYEARAVVVDEQTAIEALADLDAAAGVRAPVGAARDLDEARTRRATSSRSIGLLRASFESARSCASRVKRVRRANRPGQSGVSRSSYRSGRLAMVTCWRCSP
jgi:hypothetical protein